MATVQEAADLLAAAARDLAKWLNSLGVDLKRLEDPRAQRASAMAGGCSKAATGLLAVASMLPGAVAAEIASGTTQYSGTDTVSSGGVDDPVNYSTGSGSQTWVTADSVIRGWIPYAPVISDPLSGFYLVEPYTITPGVGFDFVVYNMAAASPYTATIYWIGYNP